MLTVTVCVRARIYRDGLISALCAQLGIGEVKPCSRVDELLQLSERQWPDVALVDIQSDKDPRAAIVGIRKAAMAYSRCAIVALGPDSGDEAIAGLFEAGAAGYVTTEDSIEELVRVLFAASRGELCCTPRVMRVVQLRLLNAASDQGWVRRLGSLSRREKQVLELVRLGRSNKELARDLCLEVATVKNHVHSVISKLQVRSRHEAVSTSAST